MLSRDYEVAQTTRSRFVIVETSTGPPTVGVGVPIPAAARRFGRKAIKVFVSAGFASRVAPLVAKYL
jgi:hypothetical protein